MFSIPHFAQTVNDVNTGRSTTQFGATTVGIQRLPTDPVFTADVTLQNVIPASRILIVDNADESRILVPTFESTNLTQGDDVVLSNVPAFAFDMLMKIIVRKSSAAGGNRYLPLTTFAQHSKSVPVVFVAQNLDEIAV